MPDRNILPILDGSSKHILRSYTTSERSRSHGKERTRTRTLTIRITVKRKLTLLASDPQTNDDLAANLASKFSSTPRRVLANSAKKRRQLPNLGRPEASPSHGAKVSMMFQDAAVALQNATLAPSLAAANASRPHLPLAKGRNMHFKSSTKEDAWRPRNHINSLPSSPHRTASYLPSVDNPCAGYPPLPRASLTESSSQDAEDLSGNSGVDLPGEAQKAGIDAWLDDLLGATDKPENRRLQLPTGKCNGMIERSSASFSDPATSLIQPSKDEQVRPLREVSNKENVSPTNPPPAIRPPSTYLTAPTSSRFHSPRTQSAPSSHRLDTETPRRFAHPTTPRGHLSVPGRRGRARFMKGHQKSCSHDVQSIQQSTLDFTIHVDRDCSSQTRLDKTSPFATPRLITQDFTVHEDVLTSALAKLSPSVELHRKDRRPKRERCVSYWDEDVLGPESPAYPGELMKKGKSVLGQSAQSEALTQEKPFTEEARGAKFAFEA
ncbi:MAG: hypothetical protein Q9217_001974 [Psora testacea]